MGDGLAQLETEYCPPLDPALLSAILSDYDLTEHSDVATARQILDELKKSALLEEQAGFDPSGTGASEEGFAPEKRAESCPETNTSQSLGTDVTSISNGFTSLDLEDGNLSDVDSTALAASNDLENLDHDTKVHLLQDIFGDHVNRYSIEHTLKKCNGKWNTAMEELLNHVYFSEATETDRDGLIKAKGIDGFLSDDFTPPRSRKDKAKKNRLRKAENKQIASLPTSSHGSPEPPSNRWQNASKDIDFISERTGIAKAAVSSIYYERGASVPQTIGALLKATMEESKLVVTNDVAVTSQARELGSEFPHLAPEYLATIVRLTFPSSISAHELAKALASKPKAESGIQIIPRHAPLTGLDDTVDWSEIRKRGRSHTASHSSSVDGSPAAVDVDAYASAQASAFAQARAAHRKAKSNHLMGGAAAYYGQVGREYAALSANASAAAADRLAASQATSYEVDLHGIDVLNGTRIARERVQAWWEGLGESRVNGRAGAVDRQMGYRIIVGLGRHSEGGKGKLGPAIMKMLRQEGWKTEMASATIIVKGPVR